MNRLVRNMVQLADVPLLEAVRMASTTPARIMGIERRKGSLAKSKDADIVLFDQRFTTSTPMIQGKIVYLK